MIFNKPPDYSTAAATVAATPRAFPTSPMISPKLGPPPDEGWSYTSCTCAFQYHISTGTIEQITSARQILRADVLGYTMTGLTPDGSPLASLIHRNSDIYVLDVDLP
ncbi:MAG TPA: hypothetical protein VG759_13455 [Candidatus Angelobacter sp.]|nr:hypothetical protein [Candidatus Angelobacter sp.]